MGMTSSKYRYFFDWAGPIGPSTGTSIHYEYKVTASITIISDVWIILELNFLSSGTYRTVSAHRAALARSCRKTTRDTPHRRRVGGPSSHLTSQRPFHPLGTSSLPYLFNSSVYFTNKKKRYLHGTKIIEIFLRSARKVLRIVFIQNCYYITVSFR